jgi:2-methylaconitate cis-trans-isomerase PrpF
MTLKTCKAVFMRGGTSKGIVFHERDLPQDMAARNALFLAAMGSPDPYGRQLNGMGGGVSSLSKVCIVGPPSRPDADVDVTLRLTGSDSFSVLPFEEEASGRAGVPLGRDHTLPA